MNWTQVLKCPRCGVSELKIETFDGRLPERGEVICHQCRTPFPICDGVLNLAQRSDEKMLTLAGVSNYAPLVPWFYENVWRLHSLSILTGGKFTVTQELELLDEWLAPQPGELIVDLGSSTDLYARAIGKQKPDATIVAVDMANGMLKAGRKYALCDGVKNIAHVRDIFHAVT